MSDAVKRVSVEISGNEISFETGKLAKQATGAVVVRAGDTMVLCTAVVGNLRDAGQVVVDGPGHQRFLPVHQKNKSSIASGHKSGWPHIANMMSMQARQSIRFSP